MAQQILILMVVLVIQQAAYLYLLIILQTVHCNKSMFQKIFCYQRKCRIGFYKWGS